MKKKKSIWHCPNGQHRLPKGGNIKKLLMRRSVTKLEVKGLKMKFDHTINTINLKQFHKFKELNPHG
jgi:hypothetical protein